MFDGFLPYLPPDHLQKIVFTIFVLAFTVIFSAFAKKAVDVAPHTIRNLLKSILDIALFLIAILIILSKWDIDIMPILTGAGILGLAVSFGAQTLVKDVIAGIFIVIENQYSVGDRVKVADHEGIVDRITLRLTILKDKHGHFVYIPNSQITSIVRFDSKPKLSSSYTRGVN